LLSEEGLGPAFDPLVSMGTLMFVLQLLQRIVLPRAA